MSDDLYGSPEHKLFRQTVRKFVQEELVPRAREFDQMGHFDKRLYRKMGELGFLGLRYDPVWAKHQVTQFKFVEMLVQIQAAKEMADACVRKRVRGEDATREITMAKLFTGRMCRYVADTCIQLQGGFGYMKESATGRGYVDMRLISIGGGADEVMIQYLAKMLGF